MRLEALVITTALLGIGHSALAADVTVAQKNKTFSTQQVQLKVGDRVVFLNEDSVTHNVYSLTKGLEFEIKTQEPGKSDAVKFDRPGVALVECAIHPKMKVNVQVAR
jgi:plastocyanin